MRGVLSKICNMSIPVKKPKELKTEAVTVRLTKKAADSLLNLAKAHNMSRGEIVEYLISREAQVKDSRKK